MFSLESSFASGLPVVNENRGSGAAAAADADADAVEAAGLEEELNKRAKNELVD